MVISKILTSLLFFSQLGLAGTPSESIEETHIVPIFNCYNDQVVQMLFKDFGSVYVTDFSGSLPVDIPTSIMYWNQETKKYHVDQPRALLNTLINGSPEYTPSQLKTKITLGITPCRIINDNLISAKTEFKLRDKKHIFFVESFYLNGDVGLGYFENLRFKTFRMSEKDFSDLYSRRLSSQAL